MAPVRVISAVPAGTAFSKFLISLVEADGFPGRAAELAAVRCPELPQVAKALGEMPRTKAAVGAGTLSSFSVPSDPGNEFFELLRSASIFGRLSPLFRRALWRTNFPREAGAGAGAAWTGEGVARPLSTSLTDTVNLEYCSLTSIIATTREVFRFGLTSEAAVRAIVVGGVARFLDSQLLDPSVTATSGRPASLTNGAQEIASSGTTASQILGDLDSMLAAVSTPLDAGRWIMRRSTFSRLAAKLGTVGLTVSESNLLGLPCVLGSTAPTGQITLLDAAAVVYATDDALEIDVDTQASLEMEDAPSGNATTGNGTSLLSLFQTRSVAIKAGIAANWQHTEFNGGSPDQPAGVSYMQAGF